LGPDEKHEGGSNDIERVTGHCDDGSATWITIVLGGNSLINQ
jgi:hypothetical protein